MIFLVKIKMKIITNYQSSNFSERPVNTEISAIVIHYTGSLLRSALSWLTDERSKVSSHYIISREGNVYNIVNEEKKAWHAGKSSLKGETNVNNFSIGIELEGGLTYENFWLPYTDIQLWILLDLCTMLMIKYPKINVSRIIGHCDISPDRKIDPNGKGNKLQSLFPWSLFKYCLYKRESVICS